MFSLILFSSFFPLLSSSILPPFFFFPSSKTVGCLRLLVQKISGKSVELILGKLIAGIVERGGEGERERGRGREEEKRDVVVVGLNGVLDSLLPFHGELVVSHVLPPLCSSLSSLKEGGGGGGGGGGVGGGMVVDCLGLLGHALGRFGEYLFSGAQIEVCLVFFYFFLFFFY